MFKNKFSMLLIVILTCLLCAYTIFKMDTKHSAPQSQQSTNGLVHKPTETNLIQETKILALKMHQAKKSFAMNKIPKLAAVKMGIQMDAIKNDLFQIL